MAIDIVYISLLIIAFVAGFRKGLIASFFSLLAIIITVLASVHLSRITAEKIQEWFHWESPYLPIVSFIIIAIAVLLLFRLLAKSMESIFNVLQLTLLNKIGGAALWVLAITMLFSTLLWYADKVSLPGETTKEESKVYAHVLAFAPVTNTIIGVIIPPVKDIFNKLNDWFDALDNESTEDTTIEI